MEFCNKSLILKYIYSEGNTQAIIQKPQATRNQNYSSYVFVCIIIGEANPYDRYHAFFV